MAHVLEAEDPLTTELVIKQNLADKSYQNELKRNTLADLEIMYNGIVHNLELNDPQFSSMNSLGFFNANPKLRRILLNSKLLDIIPGGFSIATDVTCETLIHNPVAAEFLQIEPWGQFSHSAPVPPPVKVYSKGKLLSAAEMPMQQAVWLGKEIVGYELEFVWEDGTSKIARWSASPLKDENGIICGGIATMEDITYRTQLELQVKERTKELVESNQKVTDIINSITDGFCALDSELCFTYVNLAAEKIIGSPREYLIGRTLGEFPNISPIMFEKYHQVLREKVPQIYEFFSYANKKWVEVNVYPASSGITVYLRDISERKRVEKEMARLDRLNLVGQMAAGIGHEVRNPMTTVRGFLQLLGSKDECSKYNNYYDLMIEELDRANSIITEFLSVAKDKLIDLQLHNLSKIVKNIIPLIQSDATISDKYIHMELDEVSEIPLDKKEIHQLIINLVRNGLQAMPLNGNLTIRTFMDKEEIILSVQDEGNGISPEVLEKIGTPFFTTKENGTGLGLAVCYSIVARHNAKIDIETGSAGTTFFVRFKKNYH